MTRLNTGGLELDIRTGEVSRVGAEGTPQWTARDVLMYGSMTGDDASSASLRAAVMAAHELGRDVHVLSSSPSSGLAVSYCRIGWDSPIDFNMAESSKKEYGSIAELLDSDRHGDVTGKPGGLGNASIVHLFTSELTRQYDSWVQSPNNYQEILGHITSIAGARPKLIRSNNDDMASALKTFHALTGIDFALVDDTSKDSYIHGGVDLRPIVDAHIGANRESIRQWTGYDESYLDNAILHVWQATQRLRDWRQELKDCDMIVSASEESNRLLYEGVGRGVDDPALYTIFPPALQPTDVGIEKLMSGRGLDEFQAYAHDPQVRERALQIRQEIGADCPIILYSGRVSQTKGLDDLAHAFDMVKERFPYAWLILIDEEKRQDSSQAPGTSRLESSTETRIMNLADDTRELAAYMAASDAMVIPRYDGTRDTVALEAMLMGLPVVVGSGSASRPEIVTAQLAYGAASEPEGISQLIGYVLEDPQRAGQNAAYVQGQVSQKASQSAAFRRTLDIYRQIA